MKFERLLTVGLMALFCAGTAMAASQLNSVQVTPKTNAATVSLHTTGSFAHKEYRPDEHSVLVDLTGVTAGSAVERAVALSSAVLKGYKITSYTSGAGSEVTRVELALGDGVIVEVNDKSDGLQIVLNSRNSKSSTSTVTSVAGSFPSASTQGPAAAPRPAAGNAAKLFRPVPEYVAPVGKIAGTPQAAQVVPPVGSTEHASERLAERPAETNAAATRVPAPTAIRNISVQRGNGTLDVVIEGPNSAHPFLLKNPDRLVLDFSNAVLRPSVKNIGVHTKDVLQIRVGRTQTSPPVTRIVIDLRGPRAFDVVVSATQVIVRVKTEEAGLVAPLLRSTPVPTSVPAQAAAVKITPVSSGSPAQVAMLKTAAPVTTSAPVQAAVLRVAIPIPISAPSQAATVKVTPESTAAPIQAPALKAVPYPVSVQLQAVSFKVASAPTSALPAQAPALKASSAPSQVSADPITEVPQTNVDISNSQNSHDSRAALASTPENPPTVYVAPVAVNRDSQTPDRQTRDPKVRAGIAAETMATSPLAGSPAIETAHLAQLSSPQLPGNATQLSATTSKYTGEPISVNLKDVDLKDFFRLIHEISGLNIVLDPNVKGAVTLVLDDVPWDQALDIVLKNNALDRELQGNVLRIAATDTLRREAVDRRAQSEAVALAVDRQTISRFLSYAKAKDVVPTIKKFLTARGDVISDDRTNALIISDIPSVIPNLDRLISQLDRKSQEVEIEVRVVSATRSFSRDLGFQLGFNWGNGVSAIGGSNPNGSGSATTTATTTGSTTSTTTSAASAVPLFTSFTAPGATSGLSLSNITKSYGIDAILTAAETHNLAKVLSRPRVVTQSNVKAEVKQGVKIPVYTASTSNANASVSYVDAVLRLSVTPQITSDNTIFLTVDVENTQPSGTINSNYILTTQQATTQVLVTDGGTVVIGGVIQTTNTVSTSQTPLLGDIPWLGNLFRQRSVKTETDELIFFITPKIIQT